MSDHTITALILIAVVFAGIAAARIAVRLTLFAAVFIGEVFSADGPGAPASETAEVADRPRPTRSSGLERRQPSRRLAA